MRSRALTAPHPDTGASAAEYAGLVVLAALILGTLYALGLPAQLRTGTQHALCTILHLDNCGAAPAASGGRQPRTAASRFTGGVVSGIETIAVPPSGERADLPVQASVVPVKAPRGGDNSTEHNRVAQDTKRLAEQTMGQYVTGGKVTIDCEPGGKTANCIPGGHKSGNGKTGYADVILRGYDKKTGKPVIYVWEVKPNTKDGRAEAKPQIDRYVRRLKQQNPGTTVKYGYGLPPSAGIPGNGDRVLNSWSEGDANDPGNPSRGVRFYGGKEKKQQRQRQPQEQPAPQPATPCGGQPPPMALKEKKECPVPVLPFPEIPGLPEPVFPEFPIPVPVL